MDSDTQDMSAERILVEKKKKGSTDMGAGEGEHSSSG